MKELLKFALNLLFLILVSPLIVITRLSPNRHLFPSCSELLSLIPSRIGSYARRSYYRFTMTKCSLSSCIFFGTVFTKSDVEIEDHVYIGSQCNIGRCRIGKDTLIGSGVHILSGKHQHNFDDLSVPIQQQGGQFEKITIGEDCWVGNGAIIMANVGKKCVIAAGAVVTHDVPDYAVMAGNPAKIVKTRIAGSH